MKASVVAFLILSVVGIALFGVFAMGHGAEQGHSGCIAATAQGGDCPKEASVLSFIAFHLGALRSFSTAIFSQSILFLFLVVVSLLSLIAIGRAYARIDSPGLFLLKQSLESSASPLQQRIIRWLALHENSPAIL